MHISRALIRSLKSAEHVVALTGAGTSAESGIPTFREAQTGLWEQYEPQELATPEAFQSRPRLVWQWYAWRRELVANTSPNQGHYALVRLQEILPRFTLITQNVDGLHQRAGSRNVIELHGNIGRTKCSVDGELVTTWEEESEFPPRCPRCGGKLRPDVVWFGENLPQDALTAAIRAVRSCNILLSIGTSAVIQPAAGLPLEASRNGAVTAEINPLTTSLTQYMTYYLKGRSGQVLPALIEGLLN